MREPGYDAKALLEALQEEADRLNLFGPVDRAVATALENVARRLSQKVYVKDH